MTFLRSNEINATSDFLIRSGRRFFQFRVKNIFLLFFVWGMDHGILDMNWINKIFTFGGYINGIINTSVLFTFEST